MKAQEIRKMTDVELDKTLLDLKDELFNLRFQLATGPVSYTHLDVYKRQVSTYDAVSKQYLVITQDALRKMEEVFA